MVNASLINRLSHAIDLIEQRSQQNRSWKVVGLVVIVGRIGMPRLIATSRPTPKIGARMS